MKFFFDKNECKALLFMSPFLVLVMIFMVSVFITGFFTSMTDAQGILPGKFVGAANFRNILANASFWNSVYVTVKFSLVSLIIQIPVSFMLAVWLESIPFRRMQGIIKAAFFVPSLINTVVVGILFRLLFSGEKCIANIILGFFHLPSSNDWLMDPKMAFTLLVIVSFWQCVGFQTIYFSANLKAIDRNIYEAARMDGASCFTQLREITIPLMWPAIVFMIVTSAVASLMVYELVLTLFPYWVCDEVHTIIYYIYAKAFQGNLEIGAAAAAGWVVFFMILAVSLLQVRFLGPGERHDA
jgi:ABC-type sugar transport system permease subunit